MTADEIFMRFPSFIQDYIYTHSWKELREVQIAAAEILFQTKNHLLLSSSTASGKTEAVLFPILTNLYENPPASGVSVLYIAPLKTLINDQFSRVQELLDYTGISVCDWHGDVPQSVKSKLLKNPEGILQITPESLESMLIRRPNDLKRIFSDLRYIIIDEIHTMIGVDRGSQIQCQIARLERAIGHQPIRIGLSATIGNIAIAEEWLGAGSSIPVLSPKLPLPPIHWKLAIEHFYIFSNENPVQNPKEAQDPGFEFIFQESYQKKAIIFSNSREETEYATATLRQIAQRKKVEDLYLIHHGNLSAAIREDAELKMKDDSGKNYVTCATVTMELGIDIGKLERIIEIDAPATVMSLLQRIGRSGRREQPQEMIMVFREEDALPNTPIYQLIPWDFLRGIALIELYTKERFIEPPYVKKYPFSLLFHQTLSTLASQGELTPPELAKRVLSLPPFSSVSKEDYKDLLILMLQKDMIEQTENKGFILGLKGEQLLSSFKFYAVFKDSEDFTVRASNDEIGTITTPPPVGDRFALAGKVWEVLEVDYIRKLIYVKYVGGKMEISWPGDSIEIHTKVLEKMHEILTSDEEIPYLMPHAQKRLQNARTVASHAHLKDSLLIRTGDSTYVFFPWLGTKAFRTLQRILKRNALDFQIQDVQSCGTYYITFKSSYNQEERLLFNLRNLLKSQVLDFETLFSPLEWMYTEKYDDYVPQGLLRKAYAEDKMNITDLYRRFL